MSPSSSSPQPAVPSSGPALSTSVDWGQPEKGSRGKSPGLAEAGSFKSRGSHLETRRPRRAVRCHLRWLAVELPLWRDSAVHSLRPYCDPDCPEPCPTVTHVPWWLVCARHSAEGRTSIVSLFLKHPRKAYDPCILEQETQA